LKMLAEKIKQRFRSMDRTCEISWIVAHENFQAREYDCKEIILQHQHIISGATSERGTAPTHFGMRSKVFKLFLKIRCAKIK
jgi:hypothetical protein